MARKTKRLTARQVATLGDGWHCDGLGLYLHVRGDSRSWVHVYKLNGRERYRGLGSAAVFGLADARQRHLADRKLLADGKDPLEAVATMPTFAWCATQYVAAHKAGWRNAKHADQWANTLTTYANPVFGDTPVDQVDTGLVMRVLDPLWRTKTETASRLRQRIEKVLDAARAQGYRSGENPARWRGHLDALLPQRTKVAKVRHHAALAYEALPALWATLTAAEGMGATMLRFALLTTARTGEVRFATWDEIDLHNKVWTVPAARTKSSRLHRVPLVPAAVDLLEAMPHRTGYLFQLDGKPLSDAAMSATLERLGHADVTVHGTVRAGFKTWAREQTAFPRDLIEAQLAHVIGDKAEAAYVRGDVLGRRRKLVEAWANYLTTPRASKNNVTPLRAG